MKRKIWWILVIFALLVLGILSYILGLRSAKVSEEKQTIKPKIVQKREVKGIIIPEKRGRIKVRKTAPPPKKKVVVPSDYEPVSPEVEGIEGFEEERKREGQRKDIGVPTG